MLRAPAAMLALRSAEAANGKMTLARVVETLLRLDLPNPTEIRMKRVSKQYFVALIICVPFVASAQEKQRFANMDEALQAGAILRGRPGRIPADGLQPMSPICR